jgi:hypothetical protein
MNSSSQLKNKSVYLKFYELTKQVNFYSILVLIVIGVIGNLLTILFLIVKSNRPRTTGAPVVVALNKKNRRVLWRRNSLSSSQIYMVALAISDLLFLLAHFFEDTFPTISSNHFFQLINLNKIFCKLVLYLRNGTRVNSAYLLVLFAWERYIIISSPLKRLKLLSIKNTRLIVLGIFFISFLLTSYTSFISGLRPIDNHELNDESNIQFECDTMPQFKYIYDYIICIYITIGIIVPIVLIFFFNLSIIKKIRTRKNTLFKQSFPIINLELLDSFNLNNTAEFLNNNNNDFTNTNKCEAIDNIEPLICNQTFRSNTINSNENSADTNQARASSLIGKMSRFSNFSFVNIRMYNTSHRNTNTSTEIDKNFDKKTDRITFVLMLISAIFVFLNLPYIVSWFAFFIPFKQGYLNVDQIYFRFSFVFLTEVLHMLIFSINYLFYILNLKQFNNTFSSLIYK